MYKNVKLTNNIPKRSWVVLSPMIFIFYSSFYVLELPYDPVRAENLAPVWYSHPYFIVLRIIINKPLTIKETSITVFLFIISAVYNDYLYIPLSSIMLEVSARKHLLTAASFTGRSFAECTEFINSPANDISAVPERYRSDP